MNQHTALPEALHASLAATFQHIDLIQAEEARLAGAREQALRQALHRIGSDYHAGHLTHQQLCAALAAVRAQDLRGAMHAWDEIVGVPWKRLIHHSKTLPNGPEGSWIGEYPFRLDAIVPLAGVPVVYVLFDATNEPCYVGSSNNLRVRLKAHARDGKDFVRWQAYRCRDREHAYELEDRLLKEHMPRLNRKASR